MSRSRAESGMSLIEVMIVLLLLTIMTGAIFTQISNVQARSVTEQTKLDLFQESREFMDQASRDLHQAGYPSPRNFAPGVLASGVNDQQAAVGLVKVAVDQLIFEGDVDGSGTVSSVQYYLTTAGNNCPCLRRSQNAKQTGDPLTGQLPPVFYTEVQNVQNGTNANPIFYAYAADGTQINLPVDFDNNPTTIAQIATIKMVMTAQSSSVDPQTGQKPIVTLVSTVQLNNCSQAASGYSMSCQ